MFADIAHDIAVAYVGNYFVSVVDDRKSADAVFNKLFNDGSYGVRYSLTLMTCLIMIS